MKSTKLTTEWCLINLVGLHKLSVSGMEVQQDILVKTLARNRAWWCRPLDWSFGKFVPAKISLLLLVDLLIRYLLYHNSTNTNINTSTKSEPCSVFGRWAVWFESHNGLRLSVINLVILRFVAASVCEKNASSICFHSFPMGASIFVCKGKVKVTFSISCGSMPWM